MKALVTDCSDFERIVSADNVYVDKTDQLYRLISGASSRFFIARPRRFGKSLMLSALECIFLGRKDLFDGLAISQMDYDWKVHPVVHLDMSSAIGANADEVGRNILTQIRLLAQKHNVSLDISTAGTPSACFSEFLSAMARKYGSDLVVLIDEYDAPMNSLIEKEGDYKSVGSVLHNFYLQLKVNDGNIRFLMMTGISKFAKLSVFSGLNNLIDLTVESEWAGLLGYTVPEIKRYFKEHIRVFAETVGKTPEQILAELLDWYDGYRFSPYAELKVTNPVSLASALEKKRFDEFWDETGQSTLIYRYLRRRCVIPDQLENSVADKSALNFCDIDDANSPALLFQTGYLTIKDVRAEQQLVFGIPNREVKCALRSGMLSYAFKSRKTEILNGIERLHGRLADNPASVDRIVGEMLDAAFRAIPYDEIAKDEPEVRRMFLFFCNLLGADVVGEQHSSIGRSDVVLRLDQAVFIFEFKYDHSADEALQQAINKDYAGPFANGHRPVYLVGVNYNPGKRTIDPPKCKRMCE